MAAAREKGIPARRRCGRRGFLAKRRIFAEKVLAIPSCIVYNGVVGSIIAAGRRVLAHPTALYE